MNIELKHRVALEEGHPGFRDLDYRRRRDEIAHKALLYKNPDPVQRVEYVEQEHALWREIYTSLAPMHQSHAWSGYLRACDHARMWTSRIPQLQDINDRLIPRTNFRLSPVEGLVGSRQFLSCLAESRMLCTQYIRHHSVPNYTPEPDIVHELIGHVVPFFTEDYCDLNREFGRAALRATDDQIIKIERLYWYTIEFGLLMEMGCAKAFGAGLLSSTGELMAAMETIPREEFNPWVITETPFDTSRMQPKLFCAESYDEMRRSIVTFLRGI